MQALQAKGPIVIDDSLPYGDDGKDTLDMPLGSMEEIMRKFNEPPPLTQKSFVGVPRLHLAIPPSSHHSEFQACGHAHARKLLHASVQAPRAPEAYKLHGFHLWTVRDLRLPSGDSQGTAASKES